MKNWRRCRRFSLLFAARSEIAPYRIQSGLERLSPHQGFSYYWETGTVSDGHRVTGPSKPDVSNGESFVQ
jgi:hypothetical protein